MTTLKTWTLAMTLVALLGFTQGVRFALGIPAKAPVTVVRGESGRPDTATKMLRTASAQRVRPLAPDLERVRLAKATTP
jgi:hypothetical protein